MTLLQRLFDPQRVLRPLPPPHPSARVLPYNEAMLLFRNHDQAREQSATFNFNRKDNAA